MPQDEFAPGRAERPLLSAPARLLRAGLGEPIFLFAGGGADLRELDGLLACLHTKRPLVGVAYWEAGVDGVEPRSVDAMATLARDAIQAHQTQGLYNLVGYSIGGLVALELARLLTDDGLSIAPPILLDAIPPIASWPKRALLRALPVLVRKRVLAVIARTPWRRRQTNHRGKPNGAALCTGIFQLPPAALSRPHSLALCFQRARLRRRGSHDLEAAREGGRHLFNRLHACGNATSRPRGSSRRADP